MSIKECIEKVNKAMSGGRLSKKDIKSLLGELDGYAQSIESGGGSYADALRDAGKRFSDFAKRQAAEEKRRGLLQVRSYKNQSNKISALVSQGMSYHDAMMASMVGLRKDGVKGAMNSTAAKQLNLQTKFKNEFAALLEKNNLLDVFRSSDESIQLNILRAIEQYNTRGAEKPKGEYGKIAEIYSKHKKTIRERMRRAGVDTRELDGFTITQSHDLDKMRIAKKEKWAETIKDLLDYKKIFGTDKFTSKDIDKFLDSTYQAMITGVRKDGQAPKEDIEKAAVSFTKPKNLAEKIAESRVLHFKNADAYFAYHKEFGTGSMQDGIIHMLEDMGFKTALLEDWGPNPRANFDRLSKKIREVLARDEKDLDALEKFNASGYMAKVTGTDLNALFNNIDGTTFRSVNPKLSKLANFARGWLSMSMLGQASISAISDVPVISNTLANNGINYSFDYVSQFANIVKRLPKEDVVPFASMIDTYKEGAIGAMAGRYGFFDGTPGRMADALRIFYKLNGLQWWTNAHKEGVAAALSHNLAMRSNLKFSDLGNKLLGQLESFGITEAEWDLIRTTEMPEIRGKKYITAEIADSISDQSIAAAIGTLDLSDPKINKFRQDLSDKLGNYFVETINNAVLTPGARERAAQNWGFQPGTAEGEFIRSVMLFKSFPITVLTKAINPAFRKAKNGDISNLASLIIGMTAFGAVAMAAKDVLKGRDPLAKYELAAKDPTKAANLFFATMLQGGGLGIYGDFLFGQYNRYGGSLVETAAGPLVGGAVGDLGKIYGAARDAVIGEKEIGEAGADFFNTLKRYVPGSNLPYIAPAFNYLLVYQVQEALNPGYLSRLERRQEREQGIRYITDPIDLRPSQAVK